jgi:uncharacterized membrane protein
VLILNPFDLKSALFAKHAQHVVLIHFPIALYLTATLFDFLAKTFRKTGLLAVAHWNFLAAAVMSIPVIATGLLAWRWALEGQPLRGVLRLHFTMGIAVVFGLWLTVWLRNHQNRGTVVPTPRLLLLLESLVSILLGLTAHLGGFLSGVNIG